MSGNIGIWPIELTATDIFRYKIFLSQTVLANYRKWISKLQIIVLVKQSERPIFIFSRILQAAV